MKLKHYEDLVTSLMVMLIVFETLRSWGQMKLYFIKELGSRITAITKENRATLFLFQALGLTIQSRNAVSIMGTVPKVMKLDSNETPVIHSRRYRNRPRWSQTALFSK